MVHGGQFLRPTGFRVGDHVFAFCAACVACRCAEGCLNARGNFRRVAHDTNGDFLGQADAIRVDINLNDFRVLWPVVDAVARQRREWVQARAQSQNDICFCDQLHAGFRTVVTQWASEKWVRTRERIVVLVANANWCVECFCQKLAGFDATLCQNNAGAVQDNREFRFRQQCSSGRDRVFATWGQFKFDRLWQFDVDNLGPHVARDVQLGWCAQTFGLCNHACQNFCNPCRVTNFFLVGNHVFEQFHLFNFLETALTDCLVGRLWRDQQQRRVVPVCCFNRGDEVCDARTVLRDHHGHFAGCTCVAISHHAGGAFVGAIPERDPGCWEDI